MKPRCWTDRHAWTHENLGREAYIDIIVEPSATCLLPHGHEGPHVWTNDDEITIVVTGGSS